MVAVPHIQSSGGQSEKQCRYQKRRKRRTQSPPFGGNADRAGAVPHRASRHNKYSTFCSQLQEEPAPQGTLRSGREKSLYKPINRTSDAVRADSLENFAELNIKHF